MTVEKPVMHCQQELLEDLQDRKFLTDATLLKWAHDRYSVSKHLLALYSIAHGLRARTIVEIGFGRSSFVLARAAAENEGRLFTCDFRDFSYLLNADETAVTTFVQGYSTGVWGHASIQKTGIDFAFLDYFSDPGVKPRFVYNELQSCLRLLKQNGVIAVHDAFVPEYQGIQKALRKLRGKRGVEFSVLPYNYGLCLIRRTAPSPFGRLEDGFPKKEDPETGPDAPALHGQAAGGVFGFARRVARFGLRETRELIYRVRARSEPIRITYAGAMPRSSRLVTGGAVKLLELGRRFPERGRTANAAYLVSSAPPPNLSFHLEQLNRRNIPIVWNQNGVGYPAWAGQSSARVNAPMIEAMKSVDFVIYQSEFCRSSAEKFLGKPRKARSAIVYNAVDVRRFQPQANKPADRRRRLLAAGSHHEGARILLALDALRRVLDAGENAELEIAGRLMWSDAHNEVGARIRALKLEDRVSLSGPYLQSAAPEIYARADALVHLKYMDPCPTVVLEAMACGLPILGSNSGGMPELVGGDAGILLTVPEDFSAMHYPTADECARATLAILSAHETYSRAARERAVSEFDVEQYIPTHERIFRELIGQ